MTDTQYSEWWRDHRDRVESSEDVRIDVFVRSLGAPTASQGRQAAVIERLDDLEDSGRIDRFTVQVWGDRLYPGEPCADSPVGRFLQNRINDFERWADDHPGVVLPFESKVCEPFVADKEYQCITLPRICLGVYADGELGGVVPATFGDVDITVHNYLKGLSDLADPLEAREQNETVTTVEGI